MKIDKTYFNDLRETLARAWIICDPNQGMDKPGSGYHPDDIMTEAKGDLKDKPRWHWFISRADSLKKFVEENGFVFARKMHDHDLHVEVNFKAGDRVKTVTAGDGTVLMVGSAINLADDGKSATMAIQYMVELDNEQTKWYPSYQLTKIEEET